MSTSYAIPLLFTAALIGCAGDPPAGGAVSQGGTTGEPAGDAGVTGGAGPNAGGSGGSGGDSATSDAGAEPNLAAFTIQDIPDAPCSQSTATSASIMAPDASRLSFDRAGTSGDRHFAFDSGSLAFMTFGADMASAAPPVFGDIVAVSGHAAGLRALELDAEGRLMATEFDSSGNRVGTSIDLDGPQTGSHALLATPERTLGVWCSGTALRGRWFGSADAIGDTLEFGRYACGTDGAQPLVLQSDARYFVLWTRSSYDDSSAISLAVLDPGGPIIAFRTAWVGTGNYELTGATLLGDESMALVLGEGLPVRNTLVMHLDPFGNALAGYRLLGAAEPWGIATTGSGFAVVARSAEDRAVLRALSSDGEAEGDWVCLDDADQPEGFAPRAALFAETDGYGLVVRRSDGSASYLATDARGAARTP